MAVVALQRTHRGGSTWAGHVFWAGDSRAYVFTAERRAPAQHRRPAGPRRRHGQPAPRLGGQQRHVGRHRVPRSATGGSSCRRRSWWCCATDGCFGYVPTPMHFEHLVLAALPDARSAEAWSRAVQTRDRRGHRRRRRHGGDGRRRRSRGVPVAVRPPAGRAGGRSSSRRSTSSSGAVAGGGARARGRAAAPSRPDRRRCGARYQPDYERHLQPARMSRRREPTSAGRSVRTPATARRRGRGGEPKRGLSRATAEVTS